MTDRYHIYRWMGLFRATDKMGSFMGRGKIADYNIPGKLSYIALNWSLYGFSELLSIVYKF